MKNAPRYCVDIQDTIPAIMGHIIVECMYDC